MERTDGAAHVGAHALLTFGRAEVGALFELPGPYWNRRLQNMLLGRSDVESVFCFQVHRYKTLHFGEGDAEKSVFVKDIHRYTFEKPVTVFTFLQSKDNVSSLELARTIAEQYGPLSILAELEDGMGPSYLRPWEAVHFSASLDKSFTHEEHYADIGSDAKSGVHAVREGIDAFDRQRTEVFLTHSMERPVMIKLEFDDFDQAARLITNIRNSKQTSGFIQTSDSIIGLNPAALIANGPGTIRGLSDLRVACLLKFETSSGLRKQVTDRIRAMATPFGRVQKSVRKAQYFDSGVTVEKIRSGPALVGLMKGLLDIGAETGVEIVTLPEFSGEGPEA